MNFLWLILSYFSLIVSLNECTCVSPSVVSADTRELGLKNDTLILANVIYRHGDRNINQIYRNDPYKDEWHWPDGGIGQLTKVNRIKIKHHYKQFWCVKRHLMRETLCFFFLERKEATLPAWAVFPTTIRQTAWR